ncbi:hypothetical protein RhiJN_12358 [Ceratobasidium sp. AG-Ba]|nr:hypothetical protein RhiJN_12358 [Ceratobasidium sp. AG-Ba]QRW12965.1 hypothetical protein RhiLY_11964 [Ceratobasidium sp. AG-Ba]
MASALVDVNVNYFLPPADGSKPYSWTFADHPGGGPMRNWESASFGVQAENLRGHENEYTLDTAGFQFHNIPTKGTDFDNEDSIKKTYYEESIQNIKNITGASRVVIFDHTLRKPRPAGTPETPETRGPVQLAHVDQSAEAAANRVRRHLPAEDVPSLLSKRYQIINLWRPIHNPAWQFPLALCDFRSVNDKIPGGDFIPSTLRFPDRDGETLGVKYSDTHRWKYLGGMTPDEFVLIKCFDSKPGVATFTPHTAIEDPTTPPDAPGRQSIELRALVFYD